MEFNEWIEAAIEECVLQKLIFFKIAVLQRIKLIVWSKPLKNTNIEVQGGQPPWSTPGSALDSTLWSSWIYIKVNIFHNCSLSACFSFQFLNNKFELRVQSRVKSIVQVDRSKDTVCVRVSTVVQCKVAKVVQVQWSSGKVLAKSIVAV